MEKNCTVEQYQSKIKRVIITAEEIAEAIAKVGKQIDEWYDGRPILLVSILKGSFVFMADLCRAVSVPCEIGFMCAKSYFSGTVSTGVVKITMDLEQDISNYNVVIVEDIIDSGNTLHFLDQYLRAKGAASVNLVTLFDKPDRRVKEVPVKYVGMVIPDEFIVGYGLDYAEKYRELPYLAEVIDPSKA